MERSCSLVDLIQFENGVLSGGLDDLQGSNREKKRKVRLFLLSHLVPCCCCAGDENGHSLGRQPCLKSGHLLCPDEKEPYSDGYTGSITSTSLSGGRSVPSLSLTEATTDSW